MNNSIDSGEDSRVLKKQRGAANTEKKFLLVACCWVICCGILQTAWAQEEVTEASNKNPFNIATAPVLPLARTDWHCDTCREQSFLRAGCPQLIRPHAQCSNTQNYWGWWIGGGSAFTGNAPCTHEGTWGWDYIGPRQVRKVFLGWHHSEREQAGIGNYKTDGPKLHLK
jgi:hypothetical protein